MTQELVYGRSRRFRGVLETVERYAPSTWPVLIMGETGVGKELVAQRIHALSQRRHQRFVPVNCGALPAGLFESELFGFEKGAFSGATQSSAGLVRQARGGTLFLDEVGELDLLLQVKLLRLLDSGELRSVGSGRIEQIDVRVVAATNVNLHRAVAAGTFRADLLERLCVLTVEIPPLRERPEDIVPIATSWLERIGCSFDSSCLRVLETHEWPGNVRQLRNLLVRASLRADGPLRSSLLRQLLEEECANASPAGLDYAEASLADIEKQVIVQRLKRFHGNRKRTAEELGIAKSTLQEKLKRWQLEDPTLAWPVARLPRMSVGLS